jgi:hypothetical protein
MKIWGNCRCLEEGEKEELELGLIMYNRGERDSHRNLIEAALV